MGKANQKKPDSTMWDAVATTDPLIKKLDLRSPAPITAEGRADAKAVEVEVANAQRPYVDRPSPGAVRRRAKK